MSDDYGVLEQFFTGGFSFLTPCLINGKLRSWDLHFTVERISEFGLHWEEEGRVYKCWNRPGYGELRIGTATPVTCATRLEAGSNENMRIPVEKDAQRC
jgi:hypothetical protein